MSAALGAGCKKDKESLLLVDLRLAAGEPTATGLATVALDANPGPTKKYLLSTLSADTSVNFGFYLPADITGSVDMVATAVPEIGCAGFRGTGTVTVEAAGVTSALAITMSAYDTCLTDGGTAGAGGTSGAAGSGGAGTGGGTAGTGTAGRGGAGGSGGTGTAGAAGTGTSGTGGSAGTGTSGAAGTGTAGRGGAGGSGGTGGSAGTGGMAGYPMINGCRTYVHCATSCPNTYVKAVAISPDGRTVASGGDDRRIQIWSFDGRTLTKTTTMLSNFTGTGMAFSPDGTRFIYSSSTTVRTYTVAGWAAGTTLQGDGSGNDIISAAFTPNGQRIVSADAIGSAGGDVFVHEVGGSAVPAFMAHVARQPASLAVSKVAASDGSVGIVVGTYNATVAVLTLGASGFTGAPTVLSPTATVYAVRFSANGSLVAAGDLDGIVRFWNYPLTGVTPTGTDITFAGGDTVNDIAFSPNGMYVAIGGGFSVRQLSIYNLATRARIDGMEPAGDIDSLVFSPSGDAIIAGLDVAGNVIVCN
jgi:hypothetical protein